MGTSFQKDTLNNPRSFVLANLIGKRESCAVQGIHCSWGSRNDENKKSIHCPPVGPEGLSKPGASQLLSSSSLCLLKNCFKAEPESGTGAVLSLLQQHRTASLFLPLLCVALIQGCSWLRGPYGYQWWLQRWNVKTSVWEHRVIYLALSYALFFTLASIVSCFTFFKHHILEVTWCWFAAWWSRDPLAQPIGHH